MEVYSAAHSRTFQDITSAFLSLLQEKSFSAIKVGDIIHRSRYSRGTFYSYFKSKDDCMKKIIEVEITRTFEAIRADLAPSSKSHYEPSQILAFLKCVYAHRNFYDILLENMLVEPMNQYYAYYSYQFHKQIDHHYELNAHHELKELYIYIYMHALMGVVEYWQTNHWTYTPEDIFQQYILVLTVGNRT